MRHKENLQQTGCSCSSAKRFNARIWGEAFFLALALGFLLIKESATMQTFSLVFVSIVLEAIPFMLIGSFLGGLIEIFVSRDRMASLLPKKIWLAVCLAAGMGIVFPVCECAVVPVVRRLARKGLPASAAIAYLLGGPIVNPVVAASTVLAYKFNWTVMTLRLVCGYCIAVCVALVIDRLFAHKPVFAAGLISSPPGHMPAPQPLSPLQPLRCAVPTSETTLTFAGISAASTELAHDQAPSCSCMHPHGAMTFFKKITAALAHGADDFLSVGHFLIIGAFIAALAQTFIDRSLFATVSSPGVLASVLMMALAVLLNLCSEADAFIAASFRNLLPLPAQLAFMLIGPMFDLKLLLMYQGLFRRSAIAVLVVCVCTAVLLVAVLLEAL